jgi:hypothetical protein
MSDEAKTVLADDRVDKFLPSSGGFGVVSDEHIAGLAVTAGERIQSFLVLALLNDKSEVDRQVRVRGSLSGCLDPCNCTSSATASVSYQVWPSRECHMSVGELE